MMMNMEESKSTSSANNKLSSDELEVANILRDLPYLITRKFKSETICDGSGVPFSWATKKRRSVLDFPPENTHSDSVRSPSTPLCFSPSEPDCIIKSTSKRRTSYKLTAEWKSIYDKRMQIQHHLKKLLERERDKRDTGTQLEGREGLNLVTESTTPTQRHQTPIGVNDHLHAAPSTSTQVHPYEALTIHERGITINHQQREQLPHHHQIQHQLGPRSGPQLSPFAFDLNLPAEELDHRLTGETSTAQTRINRQNRIREMRLKRNKPEQQQ